MNRFNPLLDNVSQSLDGLFQSAARTYTPDGIRNNVLMVALALRSEGYDVERAAAWQAVGHMKASSPEDGLQSLETSLTRLFAETGYAINPTDAARCLIQNIKEINRGASVIMDWSTGKPFVDLTPA